MQSKAATVARYLAELPEDRRAVISAVRRVILENLDEGYAEGMQYGAIGYFVPHSIYPAGYHCDPRQPLPFAGLGSQKNHLSLGLMCCYSDSEENRWLRAAWVKAGKKLDMGKVCIRFKKLDDVPLEVIGEAVRRVPAAKYIAIYESALAQQRGSAARAPKTVAAKKTGKPKRTKPAPSTSPARLTRAGKAAKKTSAKSRKR
ncbi:MAG: DUF1801 domain-containing protein [Phycisphaerales bacterium]|nr:DUF1801 domain-containing protein [Phycisphaerales bacterium]